MEWNCYQVPVFSEVCSGSGSVVIQARAGTGKTATAVEGTRRVPGGRAIAMVAFNKSIADTLKQRVRRARVATFHSVGHRALCRAFGELDVDKNAEEKLCFGFPWGGDWSYRRAVHKLVSLAKNALVEEPEGLRDLTDEFGLDVPREPGRTFAEDLDAYVERALAVMQLSRDPSNVGAISFDDQLWLPLVKDLALDKYDDLFIDELQDMNAAQLGIAFKMRAPGGRVFAFGDDRQAIYGFRGAKSNAIEWLAKHLGAKVLPLLICYRCDRAIIRCAQALVPDIEAAPTAGEGHVGEASLDQLVASASSGDYVLSRSNAPLISTCLRLLASGTPARIQGRDIGTHLASFVKNSRADSVRELRDYVCAWRDQEVDRLVTEKKNPQNVIDRATCLLVLSEGVPSVSGVLERLEKLFSDRGEGVVCSTIHKAKGLEADRVWLLGESFAGCRYWVEKQVKETDDLSPEHVARVRALRRLEEEHNILYVGVTRARHELYFVDEVPRPLGD